jgi:hypothetical protein
MARLRAGHERRGSTRNLEDPAVSVAKSGVKRADAPSR